MGMNGRILVNSRHRLGQPAGKFVGGKPQHQGSPHQAVEFQSQLAPALSQLLCISIQWTRGDIGTVAMAQLDESICRQALINSKDRVHVYGQFARQLPNRRKLYPRPQPPRQDLSPNLRIDLPRDGHRATTTYLYQHDPPSSVHRYITVNRQESKVFV